MQLHTDYSLPAVSRASEIDWVPSPLKGVGRKMLERNGDEVARATTIVRYAPGSHFSPHVHTGGEEFLVLEGVFSDEHGDYPSGMYVRNPVGSKHRPFSKDGCTIMVKLWQYPPEDQLFVRTNLFNDALWHEYENGTARLDLHQTEHEHVEALKIPPGTSVALDAAGGTELFVFEGSMNVDGTTYSAGDWLRYPVGESATVTAGEGLFLWKKTGHLLAPPALPAKR